MALTRKQKRYLKKHLKKKNLAEISANLEVDQKEIEVYLKKKWPQLKYQNWAKGRPKKLEKPDSELRKKIIGFSLKNFFKENWLILALLVLLVLTSYINSLGNEFVSDDIAGILNNKNLDSFSYIFSSPYRLVRFFQPGLYTSINKLFGKSPAVFRFANILFHSGTTVVTYVVVSLLMSQTTAIFASCLTAVHPIFIESVAWISGGGHCMYGFFLMLSLLFYVFILKSERFLYLSLAAFFLAVTISEKALIFPLILFVFAISYKIKPRNLKKLIVISIPLLIIGAAFLIKIPERMKWLQASYYQEEGLTNPLIQIPVATTSYLELILWPKNLTLYHSEMTFSQGEYFLRLAIFLLFLLAVGLAFKKNRHLFFWLSFFIISLLPTLTPFRISWVVAERYAYLGAIGVLVAVAIGIKKLYEMQKLKTISIILFTLVIAALMVRTIIRNADWKNQDTLWLAAAKTSPSSPQNHNNLGDLYGRRGDLEKAVEEFKKAIELKPNYGDAYHNLANTYQQMGRTDEAIKNYQEAIKFNPNLWQSYQNLAAIYFEQEKFELAAENMEKAIEVNPQNANLYVNLGVIYLKLEDTQRAKGAFQKALEIDPQNQSAQQLLLPLTDPSGQ